VKHDPKSLAQRIADDEKHSQAERERQLGAFVLDLLLKEDEATSNDCDTIGDIYEVARELGLLEEKS